MDGDVNSYTEGHGTAGYDPKNDVLRFTVKPDSSVRFYESFTIEVQDLVKNQANLYLTWANTSVHFPLVSNACERITAEILKRVATAEKKFTEIVTLNNQLIAGWETK